MIQRTQSIFLALVILMMVLSLVFPVWEKQNLASGEVVQLTLLEMKHEVKEAGGTKLVNETSSFYLAILAILAIITASYSIFRYDNRLLQMKLGLLNSVLMSALLGLSVYLISYYGEPAFAEPEFGKYLFSFYFIIVGIIANLVANRFIRKDEKLVRSADRMR